jgi:hypothetical protein
MIYGNEIDLPGELDTTLYDDAVEYFGTTEIVVESDPIIADWDDYGHLYTDLILDYQY